MRQWRARRQAASASAADRPIFETLEPKLLLSADLMPVGPPADLAVHRLVNVSLDGVPTVQNQGLSNTSRALAVTQVSVAFAAAVPTVSITGPGAGQLVAQAGGYLLQLTGTSAATSVAVVVSDGSRLALAGISASSAVGALNLSNADLRGTASFASPLGSLTLGQVNQSTITVAGSGELSFKAAAVKDSRLAAALANLTVAVSDWTGSTAGASRIEAAGLKALSTAGHLGIDLLLSGRASGFTLGSVQVGGAITGGLWSVHGRTSSISAGSTGAAWRLNSNGTLAQLVTKADASGQVSVAGLQTLQVGGSIRGMTLLVGADLGDDAAFGGVGANADTFKAGTLARVRVVGDIVDSNLFVSVDPVNGVLADGNDKQVGTPVQRIQEVVVGGQLLGSTQIAAPAFPTSVRIGGQVLNPATLARLSAVPPDTVAPVIASFNLAAASDTGAAGDKRTTQATVALLGVTEAGAALSLRRTGSTAVLASATAGADGSFSLSNIALNLGDNAFTLSAADAAGNTSQANLSLVREAIPDFAAPTLAATLQADTGRSSSDRITSNPNIVGRVADNIGVTQLLVALDPTGDTASLTNLIAIVEAGGGFTITRAKLDALAGGTLSDGAHTLRLIAKDAAGNSSTPVINLSFTLDTQAPNAARFAISAADALNGNDSQTSAAIAVLRGTAEAGSTITLAAQGLSTTASGAGAFQLPGVAFAGGDNTITLTVTDSAGNSQSVARTLTRVVQVQADAVLVWNDIALRAIQLDVTDPPLATRNLALVSLAQYDTLAAIEGTPAYLVQRSVNGAANAQAAVATAAHRILSLTYPAQKSIFDTALATTLAAIADSQAKDTGIALGLSVADAVLAARSHDGSDAFQDYAGSTTVGQWRPTGPMFEVADQPQWKSVTPFALSSPSQFRPAAPPALDTAAYAAAVNEVKALGMAAGSSRTADQTQQALFWADGKGSTTPPGHWNQIAALVAKAEGNSLSANARLFAQLNVALADAAIACWDAKYTYGAWRPETAIQNADADNNAATTVGAAWRPLLITPPHPDYVSGHATFSAAATAVLAATFGDDTAFSTTSAMLPGVTRSFTRFSQAADEAGRSRVYGGIHFEFANQAGKALGQQVGAAVLQRFALTQDTQAPTVAINTTPSASKTNLTITGQVLDNLSGVASASVRIDGGSALPLSLSANGSFSITTSLATDGRADGNHTLAITATDAAGNTSTAQTGSSVSFTLDTQAPTLTLSSLAEGGTLSAASRIAGAANPTGTTLTELSYRIDGGAVRNLIFSATGGSFDTAMPFGSLQVGDHSITLTARDAAGNTSTLSRSVKVDALAPFTITAVSPADGSADVGVTQRPQVSFSRSVNTATLTADSLYVTGPDGAKLAATIAPSADGTFAWLFMSAPMPGGSRITLHVDGGKIRAAADGAFLDADANGAAGGQQTVAFTTVSTTGVAGTKLVGRVVDPGPDLEPMTFDDIRRGPDGVIHTPDDVFLNPIAHAKVYILGQEGKFVFTDANGYFELNDVPTGAVKVAIDGRTATNAPSGVFWPEMVMAADLRPGSTNTLMGTMGSTAEQLANIDRAEVYLPRVATSVLQAVSNTAVTKITVEDAEAAPALTAQERSALTLTVQPGSAIGEDGKVLKDVKIGIATVPAELVRDMLPPGVLQHTFDITIQAPGVAAFTEPVQITFPNVFNAAPGTKLNILSFDHTTGKLVINGTGTVSADGLTVTSDEGSGVRTPGWHGMAPAGSQTTLNIEYPELSQDSDGDGSPDYLDGDDDNDGVPDADDNDEAYLISAQWGVSGYFYGEAKYSVGFSLPFKYYDVISGESYTEDQPFAWNGKITLPETPKPVFFGTDPAYFTLNRFATDMMWWPSLGDESNIKIFNVKFGAKLSAGLGLEGKLKVNGLQASSGMTVFFEDIVAHPGNIEVTFTGGISDSAICAWPYGIGNLICTPLETPPITLLGAPSIKAPDFKITIPGKSPVDYRDEFSLGLFASAEIGVSFAPIVKLTRTLVAKPASQQASINNEIQGLGGSFDGAGTSMLKQASNPLNSISSVHYAEKASLTNVDKVFYLFETADGFEYRGSAKRGVAPAILLGAEIEFKVTVFDPTNNRTGYYSGLTGQSGSLTSPQLSMSKFGGVDSDSDGISDIGEKVIGSNLLSTDSDLDGQDDMLELQSGSDLTGGISRPIGIVSALSITRHVDAVAAAKFNEGDINSVVLTANGTNGLSVVDASNSESLRVVSEMSLPGVAVDVAVDSSRALVAVAAGDEGLHIVNLANRSAPVLQSTLGFGEITQRVNVLDGIAYAAHGTNISAVNMQTGEILQKLALGQLGGGTITDLSIDGNTLYVMDANRVLRTVSIADGVMSAQGAITLPNGGGKLFVGGGVAYVGTTAINSQGYLTVDVSDPANPRLLSGVDAANIAGQSLVANGSGLLVTTGQLTGPRGEAIYALDVTNVADPTNTGNFITRINLPAAPQDVVLANGMAFVADGTGGLQVVNYIGFDNKGVAPTVSFTLPGADIDLATAGIQVQEGRTLRITPAVADDVQVRSVELLANGQVVASDVSFPFDLLAQVPAIAAAGSTLRLQVRATDTGGNVGLSAVTTVTVVPDTFGPQLRSVSLADGASLFFVRSVDVTFNEPVDMALFNQGAASLVRVGADGVFGTADDVPATFRVDSRAQGQVVSILPEGYLPPGQYKLVINAAKVADRVGNPLAASIERSFTVRPASEVRATQGTPAAAVAPSANPQQEIGVPVSFDPNTANMRFVIGSDSSINTSTQDVPVRRIDTLRGIAYFVVPVNAVSGDVSVFSQVGGVQI